MTAIALVDRIGKDAPSAVASLSARTRSQLGRGTCTVAIRKTDGLDSGTLLQGSGPATVTTRIREEYGPRRRARFPVTTAYP